MKIGKHEYARCNLRIACPICGRRKFCMISVDGKFVLCTAVSDGAKKRYNFTSGPVYLHVIENKDTRPHLRPIKRDTRPTKELMQYYARNLDQSDTALLPLTTDLGVSKLSIISLAAGQVRHGTWGFPMVNEHREVIGIKCRNLTGKKWCMKGSQLGLYVPLSYKEDIPVYVMEGESDTAAALSAGLNAIGVPSANACIQMLKQFLKGQQAYYVADNDSHGVGLKGALDRLTLIGNGNVILNKRYKDFREWYNTERNVSIKDIEQCIIC